MISNQYKYKIYYWIYESSFLDNLVAVPNLEALSIRNAALSINLISHGRWFFITRRIKFIKFIIFFQYFFFLELIIRRNFWSLLNYVPYVLFCPTCLVLQVLLYFKCLVPYVPRALRGLVPYVLSCLVCSCASRVSYHTCSRASRALCLMCLVPYLPMCPRVYEPFYESLHIPSVSCLAYSMC